MKKYREFMKDNFLLKISFFIVLTSTLLYITFFIVKDYAKIFDMATGGLNSIVHALSPLWIGLILAYLLNPLVEIIDKKILHKLIPKKRLAKLENANSKRSRFISILITYLLIILVIILLLYTFASLLLGKIFLGSFEETINGLKDFAESYSMKFQSWLSDMPQGVFSDQIEKAANSIIIWFGSTMNASAIISFIASLGGQIFNFFIGIILSIYLISDKEFFFELWNKFLYLILPNKSKHVGQTLSDINRILSKFIRGVLLDATIIGILIMIGLSVVKVEFAIFLGAFAGVTNVIPYFGPFIGMIPAFFVGTFTGGIWKGVVAVIVIFIIQQVDSNITYPRIVGSSTGLKPLFVLLSIIVFGYYMGIVGMIIAVPLASILKLFIVKWAEKREIKLSQQQTVLDEEIDDTSNIL